MRPEIFPWRGKHTQTITGRGVYPRPYQKLPIWIGVGGTPESVIRAAEYGLPMALAIIGVHTCAVYTLCSTLSKCLRKAGHDPVKCSSVLTPHTYIADDLTKCQG